MLNKIKKYIPNRLKVYINKLRYPVAFIKYVFNKRKYVQICKNFKLNFYTDVETVNEMIENKKSLSRYGDGEFLWIIGKDYESYQKKNEQLILRLKEVLKTKNEKLIIGVPGTFCSNSISSYVLKSRMHWTNFIAKYYSNNKLGDIFYQTNIYADSLISRCYIDYKDKNFTKERYSNLKRIWNNREIVIVEGNRTRLGIGNDLFKNAKKIERIICPSKDAFEKYEEIFETIKKECKNKLVILALGPTATILASDICDLNINKNEINYQAIDLGHIDIEYEWFLRKARKRIPIEGKYVNEARSYDLSQCTLDDEIEREYNSQIIATIE